MKVALSRSLRFNQLACLRFAFNRSLTFDQLQEGQEVDIELVIHYQMLSTPHAKHKTEPAKAATLPGVRC